MRVVHFVRWCLVAALPSVALAATPRLDDYARGVAIDAASQRPIVQLELPDAVYRTITTDDVSDLRVFNAEGVPVPHALCVAPDRPQPSISHEPLPTYRLQELPQIAEDGTRVEVQTPSGAQISVQGGQRADAQGRPVSAYVIDARGVADELRAVQFDWSSPDGASEVRVSIQASEDLDRWRTLVASTTLVQLTGEQQLRRHRVAIPQAKYQYLRVERVDRGPPLRIDAVVAERVTPQPAIEPVWFTADATGTPQPDVREFHTGRRAPIAFARLTPTQENMSLHVAIESRTNPDAPWIQRWSGEVFSILTESERRISPPAQFAPTTDAHWRVRLTKSGDAFYRPPVLELGYRPARLRFLSQGAAPYTLAFGSRRAEPAPARGCESLLGNLSEAEIAANIDEGFVGAERELGGEGALRPLPRPTPLRQVVLWSVLVLGVGVVVAMALSLLRRIKPDGST